MSSTELSSAIVEREIAVSNEVKLSREEFRLGKSRQISHGESMWTCPWGHKRSLATGGAGSKT